MTEPRPGEPLFRRWAKATPRVTPDEHEHGRARFLASMQVARRGMRRPYALLAAAAMLLAVSFGFLSVRSAKTLRFKTGTVEGTAGTWLATAATDELPLAFSEGTRVVMAPDSRGRVDRLRGTGATFTLEQGDIRAWVVHKAETDWRFLAGPFDVQVTGTILAVGWDPARERFSVQVDDGAVVVHGPNLGADQVVRTGERYTVDVPARTTRLTPSAVDAGVDAHQPEDPLDLGGREPAQITPSPRPSVRPAAVPSVPAWLALEERGDYDAAYATVSAAGLASITRTASPDELLRLAEVGQLSGHRDAERDALVACRRRFAGTEAASIAAYRLGRASSAQEASSWFATYLRERPAGPLAREASGRLVEALADAGDRPGARDAATVYLSRYPDGPHAPLARRVLGGATE